MHERKHQQEFDKDLSEGKCDAFALIQVVTLSFDICFSKAMSLEVVQTMCQSSQSNTQASSPPKAHWYRLELSHAFNTVTFVT